MIKRFSDCQVPNVASRLGWRIERITSRARSSTSPVLTLSRTALSATPNPPGPTASQTSPKPPPLMNRVSL
jgi:hypothetical protein